MKRIIPILILIATIYSCDKNHAPVISALNCSPDSRSAGTIFTLQVIASDEDGDKMQYRWSVDGGELQDSANLMQTKWKSPVSGAGKTFTIRATVSDGKAESFRDFPIVLGEAHLGNLEGQVNYTNFKIPVAGATITAGDQSGLSDATGHFFISGIPVGEYTVKTTKTDFTIAQSAVKILWNDTVKVSAEITSVNYTTKLSGIIQDQEGVALEGATAVVLNPDGTESKLRATTNADGLYRLWYIPFGDRTIQLKKATTEDYSFATVKQVVNCREIESQVNLVMQRITLRGSFTDMRDNHVYQFKTIGNNTWMTENLAYLPSVSPSTKFSKEDPYYYVYDYQGTDRSEAKASWFYKQYGVLYNLPAAMAACPNGWHLPDSDIEYNGLITAVGMPAGKKLKATSGWSNHGIGDNSSGFAAMPGGKMTEKGVFINTADAGYFWTTTIRSLSIVKALFYNSDDIVSVGSADEAGISVRCVRNK